MKQTFLINDEKANNKRLLLFFAGWGMDEEPFKPFVGLCAPQTDFMICYDYSEPDFNVDVLKKYTDIDVVAWSMGVWVAHCVMQKYGMALRYSVAINGTLFPVDDTKGINTSLFIETVRNLDEKNLQKFRRRMCKSSTDYNDFRKIEPKRSAHQLKLELHSLHSLYLRYEQEKKNAGETYQWDCAVVGSSDRIFLPENQLRGWEQHAKRVVTTDIAHYAYSLPFFVKELIHE